MSSSLRVGWKYCCKSQWIATRLQRLKVQDVRFTNTGLGSIFKHWTWISISGNVTMVSSAKSSCLVLMLEGALAYVLGISTLYATLKSVKHDDDSCLRPSTVWVFLLALCRFHRWRWCFRCKHRDATLARWHVPLLNLLIRLIPKGPES